MSGLSAHFLFALKDNRKPVGKPAMALSLDQIRSTAQRVASSHGLDVVDIEYQGAGKNRLLRVYIEKNAEERARLASRLRHPKGKARSRFPPSISPG